MDQLTDFLLGPIISIIFCVIELEDTFSSKEKQTVCIALLEKCCVASVRKINFPGVRVVVGAGLRAQFEY